MATAAAIEENRPKRAGPILPGLETKTECPSGTELLLAEHLGAKDGKSAPLGGRFFPEIDWPAPVSVLP